MGKIKITCDITADLSKEQMQTCDIDTMPLYIHLDDKSYKDRIDIQPEDIYEFANKTGRLPKTAAASIQEYTDFFGRFAENYDAVIHISLGSDFSSTHLNAKLAAEQFSNVYVIDSMNLSTGTGHLVLEACSLREQGLEAEQIVEKVKEIVPKVEASFVIDTLDYLKMGGRCSAMTAFSANLLNIKPNIEVIDGKMEVGKKYRGKIEKSLHKYVTDRLKGRDDIRLDRIFITHSGIAPEIVEHV
ncbi:DegV family protein [Fervidibacillus halotolerans]|uniref:DegV family protein n=1 Tax=Fervidibacillus halotolerans TaxID=2980027 RepID=A0A9E8S1A8_9BACI|nr:DegV family protein [Fervidibacillus halotolerans]WAA13337.1 DegV family protein [Fervidibacillus halotolerans]